jgi:DNA-directed RNA polymerase specialized sigma24 family protein
MRVRDGRLSVQAGESPWALLAEIAICKLINRIGHHRAAKRSVHREESPAPIDGSDPWNVIAADPEPRPEEVRALEEERERILLEIQPLHRVMICLHLQNYTLREIGQKTERTERTVSDVMNRFRKRLGQRLQELSA